MIARIAPALILFISFDAYLGPNISVEPDARAFARIEVANMLRMSDYEKLTKKIRDWKSQRKDVQTHILICLQENLDSTKELELHNYADMHVWSRLHNGKMTFQGHGSFLEQDVFLEHGRSAWAIEQLLDIRLPPFIENMDRKSIEQAGRESRRRVENAMKACGRIGMDE